MHRWVTPEQSARAAEATADLAQGPLEPRVRAALKVLTARLATKQDFSKTEGKPGASKNPGEPPTHDTQLTHCMAS